MKKQDSSPRAKFIYDQLNLYSINVYGGINEQLSYLSGQAMLAIIESGDKIAPEHKRQLMNCRRTSGLLRGQIMGWAHIWREAILELYQPQKISFEEVNLYYVINEEVSLAKKEYIQNSSGQITVDVDETIVIYTIIHRLYSTIRNLLRWIHLYSPHTSLSIKAVLDKQTIRLSLTGYALSSSAPVANQDASLNEEAVVEEYDVYIDEKAAYIFKNIVEMSVMMLGGSFNWEAGQAAPSEGELMITLPQNFAEAVDSMD